MTTAVLEKPKVDRIETPETCSEQGRTVLQKVTPEAEKEFELIPLYEPQAVFRNWKDITEGMAKILDYTCGETSVAKIQNDILSGHLLLWIGRQDNEYCGFMTTRIDNGNINELAGIKKYMSIIHLYIKEGTSPECFFKGLLQFKQLAKKWKCNSIRMWTIKAEWGRALMTRGFKPKYVEYELEVK